MSILFDAVLLGIAGVLLVLVAVFTAEVAAAVLWPLPAEAPLDLRKAHPFSVAVLIPAHNEGTAVQQTIQDVKSQLPSGGRVLVIADNCTDSTAAAALDAGAEVIERHNPELHGKGYALDFGINHLSQAAPEVVIVIDADCRLKPGALARLAWSCKQESRPIQALYFMEAPAGLAAERSFAVFAWRIKNWIRPIGLRVLGLPCQLMGTGMAFPWEVISKADLATGHIVEDLKLGLDLAKAGYAPCFCPSAIVVSEFPSSDTGTRTQRQRWEGGHLSMIGRVAVPLIFSGLLRRNRDLLALALDMAVPPLTLLVLLCSTVFLLSGMAVLGGLSSTPLFISSMSLAVLILTISLCWVKMGRDVFPLSSAGAVWWHLIDKLRLYWRILSRQSPAHWIRTERGPPNES